MNSADEPPVILVAAGRGHPLPGLLEELNYSVVQAPTGALALRWAHDLRPDGIILAADLPDMSWIDACESLRRDLRIDDKVPVLILVEQRPSPDQLVRALSSSARGFLVHAGDVKELDFKLQTYIHAKRTIDVALGGGSDPTTGLHSRSGLARRARPRRGSAAPSSWRRRRARRSTRRRPRASWRCSIRRWGGTGRRWRCSTPPTGCSAGWTRRRTWCA